MCGMHLSARLSSRRQTVTSFFASAFTFVTSIYSTFSTTTTRSTYYITSAMTIPQQRTIDSHLHIWASTQEAATGLAQEPPANLRNHACTNALIQAMSTAGIDGALLVQPIHYKFDHSYIQQALSRHPDLFKGMMLHDPSLCDTEAVARVEELQRAGFVGVRFNPYLWEERGEQKWDAMSQGAGLAVYKRCATLGMPVGVMCFQGLSLHYEDIMQLLRASPDTTMILDHFGFTFISDDDEAFDQLLRLAQYPSVFVKISALFRLKDPSPYVNVYKKRFLPLLAAFGADRLMYGSDFPYVLEQPEGYEMNQLVASWCKDEKTRAAIMGGTAEKVFGPWGVPILNDLGVKELGSTQIS